MRELDDLGDSVLVREDGGSATDCYRLAPSATVEIPGARDGTVRRIDEQDSTTNSGDDETTT